MASLSQQNDNVLDDLRRISLRNSNTMANEANSNNNERLRSISKIEPIENFPEKMLDYPSQHDSYNPNRKPGDYNKARIYSYAHKITNLASEVNITENLDEFSGLRAVFKTFPICCRIQKLSIYGPVLPMYFVLIKQMFLLMMILSLIGMYLFTLTNGQNIGDYEYLISVLQSDESSLITFVILVFSFGIMTMVLGYIFRRYLKITKLECKKKACSPSDYTLLVRQIGQVYTFEEIKFHFTNRVIAGYSLDTQNITIPFDLTELVTDIRELNKYIDLKKQADFEGKTKISSKCQRTINSLNSKFISAKPKLQRLQGLNKSGACFVTYNSKQEAKSIRRKFEYTLMEKASIWLMQKCTDEFPEYFFKEKMIRVEKAPELKEIMWENLQSNPSLLYSNIFLFILCSLVWSITTLSIYYSNSLASSTLISQSSYIIYLIFGIIISITNKLLSMLIKNYTLRDKLISVTEYSIATAVRLSYGLFVNSALPILFNCTNSYLLDQEDSEYPSTILIVISISYIISILVEILDFGGIMRRIRRARAKHNLSNFHQDKLNRLLIDPEIEISDLIASVLYPLLTCLFLFTITPWIAFSSLIYMTLRYWVDKYKILNHHMIPTNLRSEIIEKSFELFDVGILFLMIGNFCSYILQRNGYKMNENNLTTIVTTTSLGLVTGLIYCLLPNQRISRACCSKRRNAENAFSQPLLYVQIKDHFNSDYHTGNPANKDQKVTFDFMQKNEQAKQKFKEIKILEECPEIIGLFTYSMMNPSYYDSKHREIYYGPHSPYFIYPQNYKYTNNSYNDMTLPLSEKNYATTKDQKENNLNHRTSSINIQMAASLSPINAALGNKDEGKFNSFGQSHENPNTLNLKTYVGSVIGGTMSGTPFLNSLSPVY